MKRITTYVLTTLAIIGLATPGTAKAAIPGDQIHVDLILLREQMREHPELPPISFWMAVAQCETRQQWNRGHDWGKTPKSWVSGGLGIATSAWKNYGGRRFARKAAFASIWAQIIVANRIGFIGYQTKEYLTFADRQADKRFYRPPARFGPNWGGSCRRQWLKHNA